MATPCKNELHFIVPDEAQATEVKPGSDVTVPCHLSPEIRDVDMEIRWFKETDCVCLYMERQMIAGKDYKGRVGLNKEMERGNISLELKDFRESDVGDYLCQVTIGDRTEERAVRLSLKTHEGTEMLQTRKTIAKQNDKKKMEKSVLMAVFTELKKTSKCLEKPKQESKEKVAQTEQLKAEQLQTVGEPEKESTQEEDMHKPANELETSELKAEQESKEKDAEIEELKAEQLQTVGEPEKENTQQEDMHKPANELETSELNQDDLETKTTPLEKQQPNTEEVKVFTLFTGNAHALQKTHKKFIGTLQNQILNLREADTLDESNVALIFCPNASRVGTDIDAALKRFEGDAGSKLAVLVVLHHTIDLDKVIPDSSSFVKRKDMLTVDCLFNEDTGLLKCRKNLDSTNRVVNWLMQQGRKAGANVCPNQNLQAQGLGKSHKSKKDKCESKSVQTEKGKWEDGKPKTKEVKMFSILAGNTNNGDQKFIDILENRIRNLKKVRTVTRVDECDIILVFCPIITRAGTDIEAALNKLKCCTDSEQTQKPTVLVVLHHTFDPEKVVPDSSRCVNRTDILTVDCLFYEDTGLLKCQKNSDAVDKVVNWLIQQEKKQETSGDNMQQMTSVSSHPVKYCVSVTGDTQEHHEHFIKFLQKEMNLKKVPTVQESDVILLFCPDITEVRSQKSERALLSNKPVVVISLYHTVDPERNLKISGSDIRRKICPVDCIFHKGKGLLDCQTNREEISAISSFLKQAK